MTIESAAPLPGRSPSRLRHRLANAVLFGSLLLGAPFSGPASAQATNPIIIENQQAGSDAWRPWQTGASADDTSKQIKGYASATSVNKGGSINFHVTVRPAQSYTIDVFRMGWYQGKGGRLLQHIGPLNGVQQAVCPTNATTGLIECGWPSSYTLAVPSTWTSGVYLALLTNAAGFQNYIPFVVRDDNRPAGLLYQQSVTTYQAYNNYPADGQTGKSLYDSDSYGANTVAGSRRAVKVSFERPYSDYGDGQFLRFEVYFIRWLEKSGYDVSYSTNVDTHAAGARLLNYKGFLSVGHDEYWSKGMYDAAEAARDAGVSLAFFGANAVYWQIRFEPSVITGASNRVIVCYKSATTDPVTGPTKTVTWRDPIVNRPEQGLIGIQYTTYFDPVQFSATTNFPYVVSNSSHWVFEGTGFQNGNSVPGIVGYEIDREVVGVPRPNFVNNTYSLLSHSPILDIGGASDHANSSIYQAASGAWVFGAGTIGWSFGLDGTAIPGFSYPAVDGRIQRTTANILDRFVSSRGPAAPSGLGATAISASQIHLLWTDNSTDETDFVLERSESSAFSAVTSFNLPSDQTTYDDTGLAPNATYYYRVKAINGSGGSGYSSTANATTSSIAPNPPSGLGATAVSAGQINLAWIDNSSNETSFVLERSSADTFTPVSSVTLPANQTTYTDAGLTPATTYYYRVKAANSAGSSGYSGPAIATTFSVPAGTVTRITSDTPDPSLVGQSVAVSYSVTSSSPGTPTGNVTVSDGTVSCTATVAAGGCLLVFGSPGTKNLVATYTGDANFGGSASSPSTPHTVNAAGGSGTLIYVSSTTDGSVGGVAFADEDILAYDTLTGAWSMYFDGSDVGLDSSSSQDIDAFVLMPDGAILLSFAGSATIPNVGSVTASDIVRFIPTSLGAATAGTYEWYFDGSDVGLTKSGENVNAIGMLSNGDLLLSTSGSFNVPGVSGADEDLVRFTPTSLGASTSGAWSLYFDGSDVGLGELSTEDVTGAWVNGATGDLYLTTLGTFSVPGVSGDGADIFICTPGTLGPSTSCTFSPFWDGSANGFGGEILDGFAVRPSVP